MIQIDKRTLSTDCVNEFALVPVGGKMPHELSCAS